MGTSIFPAVSSRRRGWREKAGKLFVAEKQISEVDWQEKLGLGRECRAQEPFAGARVEERVLGQRL